MIKIRFMEKEENRIILCECHSIEHQIIFSWFEDENDVVYMHTNLINRSFWRRLKYGIKYIFGYKSRFGSFDEIIIEKKHSKHFKDIYEHLNKKNDNL